MLVGRTLLAIAATAVAYTLLPAHDPATTILFAGVAGALAFALPSEHTLPF